jgi:hypothetical protein
MRTNWGQAARPRAVTRVRPSVGLMAAAFALSWLSMLGHNLAVLPLPFLPFVPEQSLSHYLTHIAHALGQLPLLVAAMAALRAPTKVPSS